MSAELKMTRGIYRNRAGAEMRLLWPVSAVREFKTLGYIWEAESPNPPFGNAPYLVTRESLIECGYQLVEAEKEEDSHE